LGLHNSCENAQGIAEALGIKDGGNSYRILLDRLKSLNIKKEAKLKRSKFLIPSEEMFIESSPVGRAAVRARILRDKLITYACEACGNSGFHNGKVLSLHLDHKNGIANDHQVNNLRFLCPNCHSQTSTYAGRNARRKSST
jgi:predicted RNA-binding Zn-ribbon protein involved in translation (DUF1610 family)